MTESIRKNKKGIILMLCASVCACFGQLFWKLSAAYGIWMLLPGFGLYGCGALLMLVAYRYGKLSVLQPLLSLNYVLSIILGAVFLQETVDFLKCAGILLIIAGVILIAGGDRE